jgi:hypothetical protein
MLANARPAWAIAARDGPGSVQTPATPRARGITANRLPIGIQTDRPDR